MAIFQVTKINLLLRMNHLRYGLTLLLIPLIIVTSTSFLHGLKKQLIVIGVHNKGNIEEIKSRMNKELMGHVSFYVVKKECEKANYILHQYDILYDEKNFEKDMSDYLKTSINKTEVKTVSQEEMSVSMLMTICMILGSLYAGSYMKDREHGLIKRFRYSGGKRRQYMIGNFLSILVKLLIITIFSFLCFYLFRIINELDIERMIIQSLMVAGISSAFGMIIALLLRKELNANLLATGITTIFAILCGTFIPMDQMPKILQFINYINPFTWVLRI